MQVVNELSIGVFYWISDDAAVTVDEIAKLGAEACQLAIVGERVLTPELATSYRAELSRRGLSAVTAFAAYEGECYNDLATVQSTVGFLPRATRELRERRTREVIDFASAIGIPSFATHVGFVPENATCADYIEMRDVVRRIADYAASHGMNFCLETGQEPAPLLLAFLKDVDRSNVKINFDPANMILYGSGEPIEAFRLLRPYVLTIHGKDGDWPLAPGELGRERVLGAGSVNIAEFMRAVRESGFTGSVHVESGVHGDEPRAVVLTSAIDLLKRLRHA